MRRLWFGLAAIPWVAVAWVPASRPTTVVIGGDLGGYLSPCGCSKPMQGGIRRLAGLVQSSRQAGKTLFFLNGPLSGGIGRQNELKAETVAESLKKMACSGFNLTMEDARLGAGVISSLQRLSGGKLISAALAEDNASNVVQGREVGPFWVTGASSAGDRLARSLDEQPSSLQRSLARGGNKPVIVLFDGGLDGASEIAREFSSVVLVIYSSASQAPVSPARVNKAWLVTPGEHGKSALKLTWQDGRWMAYRAFALGPEISNEPAVSDLYRNYLDRVDRENLLEALPRSVGPGYAGTQICSSCHAKDGAKWQSSAHAHALATLEAEHADRDPDCVSCHVVGLDKTAGFQDRTKTPDLANVGCESCHGAGLAHSDSPMTSKMPKIGEESCMKCHVVSHSPTFDYRKYWLKIAHGGEK